MKILLRVLVGLFGATAGPALAFVFTNQLLQACYPAYPWLLAWLTVMAVSLVAFIASIWLIVGGNSK